MVCINCQKEFSINENWKQDKNRKFCSSSCANKWNNENVRYKKIELCETDTKVCIKCNEEKIVSKFYKRKNSVDGYRNDCKSCMNDRVINSTNIKQNKKNYYENNKEKISNCGKLYREINKKEISIRRKEYQSKDEAKRLRNIYLKGRYDNDILYKISVNSRASILKAFKRNGFKKTSKTFDLLGCSFDELKIHLENQFKEGMSWENHGEWHIDHKIPLSWAKTEEELKELCKYSNLQPLWAEENLSKKNYYAN